MSGLLMPPQSTTPQTVNKGEVLVALHEQSQGQLAPSDGFRRAAEQLPLKPINLPTEKPPGPTGHVTETNPPWSELVAALKAVRGEIEAMQRPTRKGEGQQVDYGAGTSVSTPSVADGRSPGEAQTLVGNLDKTRRASLIGKLFI